MNSTPMPGLDDVQGNILKGHGRRHSAIVLFRFGPEVRQNLRLLRAAVTEDSGIRITTAREQQAKADALRRLAGKQFVQPEAYRAARTTSFRSLALTGEGLRACGFTEENLLRRWGWSPPADLWAGMSREVLLDPEPWRDPHYRDAPHGAWILANDDEDRCEELITACRTVLESQDYGATVTGVERGRRWSPDNPHVTKEPFGFVDGFARTRVATPPDSPLRGLIRRSLNGILRFAKPFDLPLEQVVLSEPAAFAGSSFLVLRKLEQNVREFYRAEHELAPQLQALRRRYKITDPGALFIGRNRDGTPLARGGRPLDNLFHFGGDPEAKRCPFHAHIRKMNLRQNVTPGSGIGHRADQKAAQFARRGMVYGDPRQLKAFWADWTRAPKGGVGLLFLGYMSDITMQFLMMHRLWALDPRFPTNGHDGTDPLFNVPREPGAPFEWTWPRHGLRVKLKARFVTPVGGAYFLVPSLRWLRQL